MKSDTNLKLACFPRSLAATRRGFAFYVADPLSSVHEFRLNDPTVTRALYSS